ncbi:hypothetical protein Q5X71_03195 [Acinetobacter baumannii]|nr:hypothetical protein [Acinetobacter baumannii]
MSEFKEFQTGNYVVLVEPDTSDDLLQVIDHKYSDDVYRVKIIATKLCGPVHKREIRLATKEEIEAGKRLEDIKIHVSYGIKLNDLAVVTMGFDLGKDITHDLGDDFPIENHISPLCEVKDHEAK